MNKFEFFCFVKNVLVAAQKAGWEHQPVHDRYIADEVTLCFAQFEDGKEQATLDIAFDLCDMDVVKSGIAKFENCHGRRILKGENIVFVDVEKFFDLKCWVAYGEVEEI